MNRIRICVLVSGGGTNLQAIIDSSHRGNLKHGDIVCVISSRPGAYALKRAEDADIKTYTVDRKEFPKEEFENKIEGILETERIDLIVLAGFMCILSPEFTSRYPERIINVHPSLIPSFCGKGFYGLKVHEAALDYGVKVTGATVHFVNEIPDGGRIIKQKAVDIIDGDTPEILQKRVMEEAEWVILPQAVEEVCHNMLNGRKETDGDQQD